MPFLHPVAFKIMHLVGKITYNARMSKLPIHYEESSKADCTNPTSYEDIIGLSERKKFL